MKKKLGIAMGIAALTTVPASAALTTTELTAGIASAVTSAEGLIIAGFAVTALFITARILKRGSRQIG